MILFLVLLCCLFLALLWAKSYINDWSKYKDFAGPSPLLSLPILGHRLLLSSPNPYLKLAEFHEKYGDMYRCDIGGTPTVILCTYELVAEAYRMDEFNARPDQARSFFTRTSKADRPTTVRHRRRFHQKSFAELGLGKSLAVEKQVRVEVQRIVRDIKRDGGFFNSKDVFDVGLTNLVISVVLPGLGKDLAPNFVHDYCRAAAHMTKAMTGLSMDMVLQRELSIYTMMLHKLGKPNFIDAYIKMKRLVKNIIGDTNIEPDSEGNFIERYLSNRLEEGSYGSGRTRQQFIHHSLALFLFTSISTTNHNLQWLLFQLAKYPEEQEKIHQEIKIMSAEKNTDGIAFIDNMTEAHYTNAFISEAWRFLSTSGTNAIPTHVAAQDVIFQGKHFPKGTQILPGYFVINNDPINFPNPDKFIPERFINPENGKYTGEGKMFRFGMGKTRCLGESFAKTTLFLVLTSLVWEFRFEFANPTEENDDAEEVEMRAINREH